MKRKDIRSLHSKTVDELKTMVSEFEFELSRLQMELAEKKLKNVVLLQTKADDLARVKTVLTHKTK